MALGLADRIFVWSYSNTDNYTLESSDWCNADSVGYVLFSAGQFIKDQLDLFYSEFADWLNLAEFFDVEEQLQPSEVAVFLKAAGAPGSVDFRSIENYDCFSGLRAVIRHRLDQGSLDQIKLAAELFNRTIDFGLDCCNTNACAVIRVGSAEKVAPFLLERILNRLPKMLREGTKPNKTNRLPLSSGFFRLRRC
jgi:hypothetical protein